MFSCVTCVKCPAGLSNGLGRVRNAETYRSSSCFGSDSVGSISQHLLISNCLDGIENFAEERLHSRRDRPLSSGRMERVILQPFTEIGDFQSRGFLELRQVDKTLVSTPLVLVREPDVVVRSKALGDIIGIEECDPRDVGETLSA